ncbi:MAG: ZIP family metal transporter, partial [Clostridia bacterium]|nr:ZIP family metal transporter [Clostridia bacterium]
QPPVATDDLPEPAGGTDDGEVSSEAPAASSPLSGLVGKFMSPEDIHALEKAGLPRLVGLCGMLFLLVLDAAVPHMHMEGTEEGKGGSGLKRTTKLVLAVTLHNLPEGMAVGVVYAGWLWGNEKITVMGALALSLGIALQNFPEGAIVSMPLCAEGMPKGKTFLMGVLSGIVEPIGAFVTILAAGVLLPVLPYLLSFAAGAMIYVVIEELIPEMSEGEHSNIGTVCFAVGFVMMLALDVALG